MVKEEKNDKVEEKEKKHKMEEQDDVTLVRILGKDIRGDKKLMAGLAEIQGISWAFANATCKVLKLDGNKKVQDVTEDELKKLGEFVENPTVPGFLKNRQKDFDSGEDKHISGADLKLRKEFDIKRMKKIKSYKGIRHAAGLPVRGQRTKANFRKNRKKSGAVGVKK
jgi:small subunit ribosomal protein S13